MHRRRSLMLLVAVLLVVGACSTGAATRVAPADSPPASAADAPPALPPTSPPTTPAPSETGGPSTLSSAWATTELVDVATGQPFRIADLAGRTVFVETMAIWCINCRAQQRDVHEALAELDPDRVAYVVLDIDPSESHEALAIYRDRNEFTATYAIAGKDVARSLAAEFGDQVLNPPSTPMIIIGSDGRVTLTEFGHKSKARILELAQEHGA